MITQKYSVNQHTIETLLSWVESGEIAIPEIQRPFVWDSTKVRNLLDSLYKGYPVGYLIVWRNPNIRGKDGKLSEGKKILIDGQQRIMALMTSILGKEKIDKDYKKGRIIIAFNPLEEKFEVANVSTERDPLWLNDISPLLKNEVRTSNIINEYCLKNTGASRENVEDAVERLKEIKKNLVGIIELSHDLDIETVTEIFIRINSEGVPLSQADFAMSKLAADEKHDGYIMRKAIDYFSHIVRIPNAYENIKENDKVFSKTDYFEKMKWLRNENDDLYDPGYTDMLRVILAIQFERGKLSDLVSLISGRDFKTRKYEEKIIESSFKKIESGINLFINETNFKRFILIVRSAGFVSSNMISSMNTLTYCYALYLKLREANENSGEIERFIRRWFVISSITSRYSGSFESQIESDIKEMTSIGFNEFLEKNENALLSETFWDVALVQNLATSNINSVNYNVFLASQVKAKDKGFLSKDVTVGDLIEVKGDIHHVFPKEFLKKQGLKKNEYNQIANLVYMQTEVNIKIGKKEPKNYLNELIEKHSKKQMTYGCIENTDDLMENLKTHCIPESILQMSIDDYEEFLKQRRRLMAEKIKKYYKRL
jgi:hypothetical protein